MNSKRKLIELLDGKKPIILYFWRCFAGGCLYVARYGAEPRDDEWIEVVW